MNPEIIENFDDLCYVVLEISSTSLTGIFIGYFLIDLLIPGYSIGREKSICYILSLIILQTIVNIVAISLTIWVFGLFGNLDIGYICFIVSLLIVQVNYMQKFVLMSKKILNIDDFDSTGLSYSDLIQS